MTTRRLLLITYVFPPFGGIPVQRALNFARYLPAHGIEVHVLTAWNAAAPVRDESLLSRVPSAVKVHRVFTPEPPFYLRKKIWELLAGVGGSTAPTPNAVAGPASPGGGGLKQAFMGRVKKLLTPDPQVLWTPFAISAAARLIRRHSIDTVMVTAPPFSMFLIGNELKRRFPALRLVSDFRDEWIRFQLADFAFHASGDARARAEQIERDTIESSDLVVAVTRASLDEIRARHPGHAPEKKFALVPNGYDPEAMSEVAPRQHQLPGRMVITHMGTAYTTASPKYFLDALNRLPPALRDRIELRFIGRIAETETRLLENHGVTIRLLGFMPQAEAWHQAAETDYFLLTMTNDFSIPGKLFEYMAIGRPVLALSPPGGEVDRLLQETRTGWCVPHDDPAAIAALVESAWRRLENGAASFHPDRACISEYERPRLAARLAALLRD